MNKTELVAAVAEETGKSKADVKEILEALIREFPAVSYSRRQEAR